MLDDLVQTPVDELNSRMARLRERLSLAEPDWRLAVVMGRVNLFYLTGCMQDGVLMIPRDAEEVFWVRRSFERARAESAMNDVRQMSGFRDIAAFGYSSDVPVLLETESVPLAHFERFNKHFGFSAVAPLDMHLLNVRSLKSSYELDLLRHCGEIHRVVTEEELPKMLREGMSEAQLGTELLSALLDRGHHGLSRVRGYNSELLGGQICFGENSMFPHGFNGPGGVRGLGAGMPTFGSRECLLKRGDLVSVDMGCGYNGYHTDKTITFCFGFTPDEELQRIHALCVSIQDVLSDALRPGAVPSEIYAGVLDSLDPVLSESFMNCGGMAVKFLGHGVGLHIDEMPVIAGGFDEPLQEGMVLAVEPKAGIPGVGMVGIENTFVVTPGGGQSITGDGRELVVV